MSDSCYDLARKYAIAFVNVYDQKIPESAFDSMKSLSYMFHQHKNSLVLLTIPRVSYDTKYRILKQILAKNYFDALIRLLLRDNRVVMLPDVLNHIADEYYKRHNTIICTIASSSVLTAKETDTIVHFLTKRTSSAIKYTSVVDSRLIAGIRVYSNQFIWEYSIRNKLRQIKQILAQR